MKQIKLCAHASVQFFVGENATCFVYKVFYAFCSASSTVVQKHLTLLTEMLTRE